MKKKYMLGLLLGSTAISGVAMADDWSGFYLGAQGGYLNLPSTTSSASSDAILSGGLLGIDVGFDHQFSNNFVLGAVGDWSFVNATGNGVRHGDNFALTLRNLGRAQLRAGMAVGESNNTLIYLGGGLAVANLERGGDYNGSNTHLGFVVSAGVEHKFTPAVSIKAEASYLGLGNKSYGNNGESVGLGGLMATLGVNFHF
ncbi:outer membrane protein [Aestuariivirga litoralis]|uniref:outer membrane protein n=1 Tax=Aestuariivirga litoralis TaxID=2650924 RepID=UPI0018C49960|nr:outer membrane beta-barrel protein [Aestuariivirga litoralis]MBG1231812.1 porin family protein [Aestuariivirga litoralis]